MTHQVIFDIPIYLGKRKILYTLSSNPSLKLSLYIFWMPKKHPVPAGYACQHALELPSCSINVLTPLHVPVIKVLWHPHPPCFLIVQLVLSGSEVP